MKPERYGLGKDDERYNLAGILHTNDALQENTSGGEEADFKTILNHLQAVYCGKIAYEFMHIPVSLNACHLSLQY